MPRRAALRPFLLSFSLTIALALPLGCAELQSMGVDLEGIMAGSAPLDGTTVARGLKQALEVGTRRSTERLSRPGGFADDPVLRIGLPEELDTLASMLRSVGLGSQVDRLEASMNLAAERAVAEAMPVFAGAITSMTIEDAFSILEGKEDAATRYFEAKTGDALRARFQPIAASAMQDVGLYEVYRELIARYERIPLTKPPALDLEAYVTERTLAALFDELAREEALIRRDPAARSTALLRRVFGSTGAAPAPIAAGS